MEKINKRFSESGFEYKGIVNLPNNIHYWHKKVEYSDKPYSYAHYYIYNKTSNFDTFEIIGEFRLNKTLKVGFVFTHEALFMSNLDILKDVVSEIEWKADKSINESLEFTIE